MTRQRDSSIIGAPDHGVELGGISQLRLDDDTLAALIADGLQHLLRITLVTNLITQKRHRESRGLDYIRTCAILPTLYFCRNQV
jgi:hypothetical protein